MSVVARALAGYADAPRGVRFHVRVRAATCPFADLEARVPITGRVLDLGCGHGLLSLVLALGSGRRDVLGVDIDGDKVAHAVAAARALGLDDVRLEVVDVDWRPDGPFDAIVLADVLYLLGRAAAGDLLAGLASALAPGGVLLVKEIDVTPRWKYQLARLQELVSTRVTRITAGDQVDFVAPSDVEQVLEAAGLVVEHVPLHRHRPHPHHLVVGRRSGSFDPVR